MPVLLPNWALSECFFKVNLSEEGTASKPLGYSSGIVYYGVAESDGLWVNVIVNAKAIRGREVCDNPPCAILFWDHSKARAVEGLEWGLGERPRHAA